ncbi:MAG: LacI family DNA-binding transcriptional regulator [bacterium]
MAVNIKQVAQVAGVAVSTASMALNNTGTINKNTRLRIKAVAKELGYAPSPLARSLVLKKTDTIGIVIPNDINPVYMETCKYIEIEAKKKGYKTYLFLEDVNSSNERLFLETVYQHVVDGLILNSPLLEENKDYFPKLQKDNVPVVFRSKMYGFKNIDWISIDGEKEGFIVTKHLIEMGHKRIGCVETTHRRRMMSGPSRVEGYKRALRQYNIKLEPSLIKHCEGYNMEDGYTVAKDFIEMKERPTAMFMNNDFLALGAIRAVNEAGLKIPHDMAIVGADNIEMSRYCNPPLTTIGHSREKEAKYLIKRLVERIQKRNTECEQIVLEPKLIVRESTRKK